MSENQETWENSIMNSNVVKLSSGIGHQ